MTNNFTCTGSNKLKPDQQNPPPAAAKSIPGSRKVNSQQQKSQLPAAANSTPGSSKLNLSVLASISSQQRVQELWCFIADSSSPHPLTCPSLPQTSHVASRWDDCKKRQTSKEALLISFAPLQLWMQSIQFIYNYYHFYD